jgi:hypothetical protein
MTGAEYGSDSVAPKVHQLSTTSKAALEIATPWLLLLGGFLFGVGWIAGLYGLWRSKVWSVGDKILGTLVWPGGLATVAVFFRLASNGRICLGSATYTSSGPPVCAHTAAVPASNLSILIALFAAGLAALVVARLQHVRQLHSR